MQRFSDPALTQCEDCSGQLRKLISMSTFHLKGSGWYTTDYAGKNQSTAKPAECKTSSADAKTESASSESASSTKSS